MIGIDQYGSVYKIRGLHPRKELLQELNATHASKIYQDRKDDLGTFHTYHVGYIIRGCWITLYRPWLNWEGRVS